MKVRKWMAFCSAFGTLCTVFLVYSLKKTKQEPVFLEFPLWKTGMFRFALVFPLFFMFRGGFCVLLGCKLQFSRSYCLTPPPNSTRVYFFQEFSFSNCFCFCAWPIQFLGTANSGNSEISGISGYKQYIPVPFRYFLGLND